MTGHFGLVFKDTRSGEKTVKIWKCMRNWPLPIEAFQD